jgi:hypothetical protein
MMVDLSQLKTVHPRQTINGKLVGEADRLEDVNSQLKDLTQKLNIWVPKLLLLNSEIEKSTSIS